MSAPTMSSTGGVHDEPNAAESTVQDLEGNSYPTVRIGRLTWLAENLRSTRFQDGSEIRTAYIPDDDENNLLNYGRLYDWHDVIDERNVCPVGWRVASDIDWKDLERAIGVSEEDIDTTGWRGDDDVAITLKDAQSGSMLKKFDQSRINQYGFNARPAGVKLGNWYITQGVYSEFWTSSDASEKQAYARTLAYSWWNTHKGEIRRATLNKDYMFSVRCVKD